MATRHKRERREQRQRMALVEPVCAECGGMGVLVGGDVIYPHRADLAEKLFYRCDCGAYVGCHPGTEFPLGTPAGAPTRKARSAAHEAFDPLWKAKARKEGISLGKARGAGYAWLSTQLGLRPEDCHISMMDAAMAGRVVEICNGWRKR